MKKYMVIMEDVIKRGLGLEKRYAAITPVGVMMLATPIILVIVYGGYLIAQGELNSNKLLKGKGRVRATGKIMFAVITLLHTIYLYYWNFLPLHYT
ncbi:hypothetical protein D3C74_46550 [compost metagenome]